MRNRSGWIAIAALVCTTLACNLGAAAATPTATLPPLPFPTDTPPAPEPSATATVALEGTAVSFGGVSMIIPEGLGTGAAAETIPASTDSGGAPWDVHPAYTQFTLQGYPLQDKFFTPQIFVYPAKDFAQLQEGAAAAISALQILIANPGNPLPTPMPFLPPFNAAQLFTAQPQGVQFQNGSGVRYLTEFAQYAASANNKDLFYTYQGLTSDGKYYIAAVLPANAPFLAEDENPDASVPPDGIPFDPNSPDQYYAAVVQKLNGSTGDTFAPSLSRLDALVQSLNVTGP